MPESPLVQKETVALSDLEALIAARAKGESETELGFRKRIEREEAEYHAAAKQLGDKYKVDNAAMEADYSQGSRAGRARRSSAIPRRPRPSTTRPRSRSTNSSRKTHAGPRRPRKRPAGKPWRCSRARATRASSGGGARTPTGREEIGLLHQKQASGIRAQAVRPARDDAPARCRRRAESAAGSDRRRPQRCRRDDAASDRPRRRSARLPKQPADTTPLGTLQGLLTRIEEHLIALDALKLPKFLKIDTFIWPWLLLGGGVAAGLGFGTPVGWTTAGIVGGVVGRGVGDRRLPRT